MVQIALSVCLLIREKEDLKLDRWGGSRRSWGMGMYSVKKYFQFKQREFDFESYCLYSPRGDEKGIHYT